MKVLITDSIADAGIQILSQSVEVDKQLALTQDQLRSIINGYEALIVRSQTKVSPDIINAASNLRVIARCGVGIDNIDVDAATKRGILVINSPEGNIVSTAEHTIAMLLALARQIPKANSLIHDGNWARQLKGFEIRNKTLGVIGLGRVGTEVSQLGIGLHMNIMAYDPVISKARASRLGVQLVDLEVLLETSDFITIHVPLNTNTIGLIGPDQFKLMKPTALLVNCARGGIVDETALYEALEQGLLAGAAIDVFSKEPAQDNILLQSDKVIATPHLAASTVEAEISASIDIAEQVVAVLKGYPAKFPINAPMIEKEAIAVLGPYLDVANKIGRIAAKLSPQHMESLSIQYQGDIARQNTEPVKTSVLIGLLIMVADERINMVNADFIANNRGLRITEEKSTTCENYANMITVEVGTSSESITVAGTSLRGRTYLTRVNDYWLEIEISDHHMLFTEHMDRPGIVGAVGSILGNAGINISQMQVSRGVQQGRKAMMAVCLDQPLPIEYYQQILAIPDMYKAIVVELAKE